MNYRCRAGEIDIVCSIKNILVFVEVKTRNSLKYGHPSESITAIKREHIKRTAGWYIATNGPFRDDIEFRFDVIEVLLMNEKVYVNHIQNAFE